MSERRWRTKPDKPAPVKVTKPNPETGEVTEITRAESTVKANARKARRRDEPPNLLGITGDERREIIAGRQSKLVRAKRIEGVEKGYTYILAWAQLKSFADPETKTKLTPEAHPAVWVTVKGVKVATGKAAYEYVLKVERQDVDKGDLLLQVAAGYTRDRSRAVDRDAAPVLSEAEVAKIDVDARRLAAERRDQDHELRKQALKRQEAVVREALREAQSVLSPVAYQALLASFEADLKSAIASERKAA